jgi:hypothetical protein
MLCGIALISTLPAVKVLKFIFMPERLMQGSKLQNEETKKSRKMQLFSCCIYFCSL